MGILAWGLQRGVSKTIANLVHWRPGCLEETTTTASHDSVVDPWYKTHASWYGQGDVLRHVKIEVIANILQCFWARSCTVVGT